MKVVLSKRASRAIERINAYWFLHGYDPSIFVRELREAFLLITTTSGVGLSVPTPAHPRLRRLLLEKAHCHIFFESKERRQEILIVHIWDARRERPPKL